jgi:hypothetical protein
MERAELRLFRAISGYRMTAHKSNEDISKGMRIICTNIITKLPEETATPFEKNCWKQNHEAAARIQTACQNNGRKTFNPCNGKR